MNYRHSYHAGNFADVLKHIILIALIKSLQRKDTGFCYLETHAGIGLYDLFADTTQKCKEFEDGVKKIMTHSNPSPLVNAYLACVNKLNTEEGTLRYYPGSPYFARQFLREQDRMVLSELHPEDVQTLKRNFKNDSQIAIHHQDGYQSLKAFLPPKERRGLVLIDPAYEKPDELANLPEILAQALKRFETGIYAVWYPIKNPAAIKHFYRELKKTITKPLLISELCVYADDVVTELNGCGMVIINPPWQFDEELKTLMPWLWDALSIQRQGRFDIKVLST